MMKLKPGGCSLHLDVKDAYRSWEASPDSEPEMSWNESQLIYGSAQLTQWLGVIRSEPSQIVPLTSVRVALYPTRSRQPMELLQTSGVPEITSVSFLSHHDARAASPEDPAEPEQVFLTVTVPDAVFDRVWTELDVSGSVKKLYVGVMVRCLMEEHWMQQYYLQPDSVNVAWPNSVAVLAVPPTHPLQV